MMNSSGYLDQEAQRVRSDLDNVFADFDKVARGTLRLKKMPLPEEFPEPEQPVLSPRADLSSFDDIMTLTQNLDEELSAWDSIVTDDSAPLMIGSYVPSIPSTTQVYSQPQKPQAADPPSSLAYVPYYGTALPAQSQAEAPVDNSAYQVYASAEPAAPAATNAVQASLFQAPVVFSSQQLGKTQQQDSQSSPSMGFTDEYHIPEIVPIVDTPVPVNHPRMPMNLPKFPPAQLQQPQQPPTQLAPGQKRAPAVSTPVAMIQQNQPMPVSRGNLGANAPSMVGSRSVENISAPMQQAAPVQPQQPPQPTATPPKRAVFKRAPTEPSRYDTQPAESPSSPISGNQPQQTAGVVRAMPKVPPSNNPGGPPPQGEAPKMSPSGRPMLTRSVSNVPKQPMPNMMPSSPSSASHHDSAAQQGSPQQGLPPRQLPPRQSALPSPVANPQPAPQQLAQDGALAGAPPKRMVPGGARPKLQKSLSIGPAKLNTPQGAAEAHAQESPASIYRPMPASPVAAPGGQLQRPQPMPNGNNGAPVGASGPRPSMAKVPMQQMPPRQQPQPQHQPQSQPQPHPVAVQHAAVVEHHQPPSQVHYHQQQAAESSPVVYNAPRPEPAYVQQQQPQQYQQHSQHYEPQQPQIPPMSAPPQRIVVPAPGPVHHPDLHQFLLQQAAQYAAPTPVVASPVPVAGGAAPPRQPNSNTMEVLRQMKMQLEMKPLQIPPVRPAAPTEPAAVPIQQQMPPQQIVSPRSESVSPLSPRSVPPARLQPIIPPTPQLPPQPLQSPPVQPPAAPSPGLHDSAGGSLRPRERLVNPSAPAKPPPGTPPPTPLPTPTQPSVGVSHQMETLFPKPQLPETPPARDPGPGPFQSFEELVLDDRFGLMLLIADVIQVTEATKICAAAIKAFLKHNRVVDMIKALIYNEVGQQLSAGTLFRNNSIATHMMTSYTKVIGLPYLKSTIGPELLSIFEDIDVKGKDFEIDPEKLGPKDKLDVNVQNLKGLIHRCFDRILNSRGLCPKPFLHICNALQAATRERFPESKYIVIAGFLFLRYICPAVVAPDGYKLISGTVPENVRRVLVLLSKVLQTIANEREFGDKEAYMMCMNQLCVEYRSMLQYFFNNLAKTADPLAPDNTPPINLPQEEYDNALKFLLDQVKLSKAKFIAEAQKKMTQSPAYWSLVLDAINQLETLPLRTPEGKLDPRFTTSADVSAPPVHVVLARDNLMSQLQQFREMKEQMERNRPTPPLNPASPPPPQMLPGMQQHQIQPPPRVAPFNGQPAPPGY